MTHLPALRSTSRLVPAALGAALLLAACGGGTGPSSSVSPSASPTTDPTIIQHPTGADEIILRFEVGGGFVPMEFNATAAPIFTLYGDGTAIFRDATVEQPPAQGQVIPGSQFLVAHMDEDQIQELLSFALGASGLGAAKAHYDPGTVADAPTATFTVAFDGRVKTVGVVALDFFDPQNPDAQIVSALAKLGERLNTFGGSVAGETPWVPDRYRGMLLGDAFGPTAPWPWPDLTPADFTENPDPNAPSRFPSHVLTPAQIQAVGIKPFEGGFMGMGLNGPDGKTYAFAVRPLFPDEDR